MARVGDVFEVRDGSSTVGVLHYIGKDATQLHSHVVRAYRCAAVPDSSDLGRLLTEQPAFCTHVVIPVGVKHGVLFPAGTVPVPTTSAAWFRQANDYGNQNATSDDWSVWQLGEPMRRVAALSAEQRKYELGLVVNPFDVLHRLRTGRYEFRYPEPL